MSEKISPQGYNYGSQPFQKTPFWGGSDGEPSEYVKNISEEKTETEEKTTYKISYTDQDDNTVSLDAIEVPKKSESSTVAVKDISMSTDGSSTTFTQTKTDGTSEIVGTVTMPEVPDVSEDIVEISRNIVETSTEKTVSDSYKTKGGALVALKSIVIPVVEKITDYIQNVDASITKSGINQILRLKKTKGGAEEGEYCNFETVQPDNTVTDVGVTPYTKSHWKQRVLMATKGTGTAQTIGSFNDYFEADLVNNVSLTSSETDEKTTYTLSKTMCDDVTSDIGTIDVPKSSGGGSDISLNASTDKQTNKTVTTLQMTKDGTTSSVMEITQPNNPLVSLYVGSSLDRYNSLDIETVAMDGTRNHYFLNDKRNSTAYIISKAPFIVHSYKLTSNVYVEEIELFLYTNGKYVDTYTWTGSIIYTNNDGNLKRIDNATIECRGGYYGFCWTIITIPDPDTNEMKALDVYRMRISVE